MKIKKIEFVVLGVIVFILSGILFLSLSGFSLQQMLNQTSENIETREYTFNSISEMEIDLVSSHLEIEAIDTNEIKVIVSGTKLDWIEVKQKGAMLNIRHKSSFFNFGFFQGYVNVKVIIPQRMLDEIDIDTVSGGVVIKEVQAKKMVVNSVSGKMWLDQIDFDLLDFDTVSGNVDLLVKGDFNQIDGDSVSGSTTIWLEGVDCVELNADTLSGQVINEFKGCAGQNIININNVSGSIRILRK